MLTEGVSEKYQKNGETVGARARLADFQNPSNNNFVVCNQFTLVENEVAKRPDLVLSPTVNLLYFPHQFTNYCDFSVNFIYSPHGNSATHS